MKQSKNWKPRVGDRFWYIEIDGDMIVKDYYRYEGDPDSWFDINCFRTRKQALSKLKEIKEILYEKNT